MRVVAVGSRSFVTGFRLAGVEAVEIDDPKDALQAIKRLMSEPDVGLIIVSEEAASDIRGELAEIRAKKAMPLIYELPSTSGSRVDYRFIIRQVLGI